MSYPLRRFPRSFVVPFLTALLLTCSLSACGQEDEPARTRSDNETKPANQPRDLWTRTKGGDWPTFLGPTGDSHSTEMGILTDWADGRLRVVWKKKLGESYGIGSVAHGRMFQFDRVDDRAILYCLNAETGESLWTFDYPTAYVDLYGYNGGPRCSPVIDGDYVYLFGVEGMLYCLDWQTGEEVWKVDTSKEYGVVQNFFGVGSTPVIEGDLLIVMIGGSPAESQALPPGRLDRVKPNGSAIVAFDKRNGTEKYRVGDDLASYASLKTATIDGRRWGFAFARAGLIGFDPATGEVDFNYPWRARSLESVNASTPVVHGDEVFISETYGPGSSLLRVQPGEAEVVWKDDPLVRDKAMQTHWNTAVLVDGYLYGSSGRHAENAELRCIEWSSGKVMWSQPGLSRCSLLAIDGHLVVQAEYGHLLLVKQNPEKFELVEQVLIEGEDESGRRRPLLEYPAWAAPIVAHGLMYVRGKDYLVCLELIPE